MMQALRRLYFPYQRLPVSRESFTYVWCVQFPNVGSHFNISLRSTSLDPFLFLLFLFTVHQCANWYKLRIGHLLVSTMATRQWSETKSGNIAAHSCNHCYRGKAISITNSECASEALAIQHAKSLRHITLLSVACPAIQYFSTLSHNRHHIRKNYWT
jgi:hypothetical protein